VKMRGEVPEFQGRDLVRIWRVPVQRPCEVPVGSGADAL
jgi:hypothetical protein